MFLALNPIETNRWCGDYHTARGALTALDTSTQFSRGPKLAVQGDLLARSDGTVSPGAAVEHQIQFIYTATFTIKGTIRKRS